MALLVWDDSYSVGVSTLDNQHSVLFKMINELDDALIMGNSRNITQTILRRLLIYTRGHFSAEEAMMASAKFPGLEEHRQTHRTLTKHVEEIEARYERGEGTVNVQLLSYLRDWVTDHVLQSDKQYGPWINKTGVR